MPSCADELERLIELSDRTIIDLTGPTFPNLTAIDAAVVLLSVALKMPEELRLRTLHLAVNLLHTGDWSSAISTAAQEGDPLATALIHALVATYLGTLLSDSNGGGLVN